MDPTAALPGNPLLPTWEQLRPFAPEIWLVATIAGVLTTPFFTKKVALASSVVALSGALVSLVSLIIIWSHGVMPAMYLHEMLLADPISLLWHSLLLLFLTGIVLLSFANRARTNAPEFYTLILGATVGLGLMSSTSNLLMIFLAVEMASLPSYALAGFDKTSRRSAEGALKYVLFGASSTAVMLYGLSLIYGLCGNLQIGSLVAIMQPEGRTVALLAITALLTGVAFKIAAVPLHWWCPDVFEGAPLEVAAFLSVASKGAGLVLLLRIMTLLHGDAIGLSNVIIGSVGVIGALTATAGNVAAFVQTNLKRLLAYSSIAQAGYMLCALTVLAGSGELPDGSGAIYSPGAQALMIYLAVYLFMNLGAFAAAMALTRLAGGEAIADLAGLGRAGAPITSAALVLCLLSLIGVPPVAGLLAKLNLLLTLGAQGGRWWILVGVIGVNAVFSAYYYLRIIRSLYLGAGAARQGHSDFLASALAVVCALVLVAMLIGYAPMSNFITRCARMRVEDQRMQNVALKSRRI